MPVKATEENYPLLLLFLDDTNNRRNKTLYFDNKNRYSRITEGASNILTQWPNHISTCWLTAFVFLLLCLVLLSLFLLTSIHPTRVHQRCFVYDLNDANTKIYLVHHGKWSQVQFGIIEKIMENYPGVKIDIISLRNQSFHHKHLHRRRSINKRYKWNELDINVGRKDILKVMRNNSLHLKYVKEHRNKSQHALSLHTLLSKHPTINLRNETMENYFAFTPIYDTWKNLNLDLAEFAARVYLLWEFGGLSFKLPESIEKKHTHTPSDEQYRIETFIQSNLTSFKSLPKGVVNVDAEGVHMETNTPCHAFLWEMNSNLRKANWSTTVDNILHQSLKTFCLTGAVTDAFCSNLLH